MRFINRSYYFFELNFIQSFDDLNYSYIINIIRAAISKSNYELELNKYIN